MADPENDGGKSLKRKNIVFALERFQHFLASHNRLKNLVSKHDKDTNMSIFKKPNVHPDINFQNKGIGVDILDDARILLLLQERITLEAEAYRTQLAKYLRKAHPKHKAIQESEVDALVQKIYKSAGGLTSESPVIAEEVAQVKKWFESSCEQGKLDNEGMCKAMVKWEHARILASNAPGAGPSRQGGRTVEMLLQPSSVSAGISSISTALGNTAAFLKDAYTHWLQVRTEVLDETIEDDDDPIAVTVLAPAQIEFDDGPVVYKMKGPTMTFICVDESDKTNKTVRIEHEVPFDDALDLLHNEFGRPVVIKYADDMGKDIEVTTEHMYEDLWDAYEESGVL